MGPPHPEYGEREEDTTRLRRVVVPGGGGGWDVGREDPYHGTCEHPWCVGHDAPSAGRGTWRDGLVLGGAVEFAFYCCGVAECIFENCCVALA